jgi:hypothetical protein
MSINGGTSGSSSGRSSPTSITKISAAIASNLVSSKQHRIPIFNGKKDEDPIKFLRIFLRVAKALKWDDPTKLDKFPNYLAGAAEEWHYIKIECISAVPAIDWDGLKKAFEQRFLRGDYKSHLMRELRERKMKEDETLISYITAIETLCHDLDDGMSQEQIIDYVYAGLDRRVAAQIAFFAPKDIDAMQACARNIERGLDLIGGDKPQKESEKKVNAIINCESESNKAEKEMTKDPIDDKLNKIVEIIQVLALGKNGDRNRNNGNYQNKNYQNRNQNNNQNSGNSYNYYKKSYNPNFKKNIKCYSCGKMGHIAKQCRSKNIAKKDENESNANQVKTASNASVNSVNNAMANVTNNSFVMINVIINDKVFKALVDSGAEVSLMKYNAAKELGLKLEEYKGPNLNGVSGEILDTNG